MPQPDDSQLLLEAKTIINRFLLLDPELCKIPPLLRRDAELLLQDKFNSDDFNPADVRPR